MNLSDQVNLQLKTGLVSVYGISDTGMKRKNNEDSIFIDDCGKYLLLADGMGGQSSGALASSMTLKIVNQQLLPHIIEKELIDITESDGVPSEISALCSVVKNAVSQANKKIYQANNERHQNERSFMGTTLVGIYFSSIGYAIAFHIGDSRIYRFRNGSLSLLTRDHSLYEEWLQAGEIGKAPGKNVLTRAIGFFDSIDTDISCNKSMRNDIYLLCSDGLTGMVSDDRIETILSGSSQMSEAAGLLVKEANNSGGKDNISAILCRINKT